MLCVCSLRVAMLGPKFKKLGLFLKLPVPQLTLPPIFPEIPLIPPFPPKIDPKLALVVPPLLADARVKAALDLAALANLNANAKAALKLDLSLPGAGCMMGGFASTFKTSGLLDMLKSMGMALLEKLLPIKDIADAARWLEEQGLDPYSPKLAEELAEKLSGVSDKTKDLLKDLEKDPITPTLVAAVQAQEAAAAPAVDALAAMQAAAQAVEAGFGVDLLDPDALQKLIGPLGGLSANIASFPSLADLLSLAEALLMLKILEALLAISDYFGLDFDGGFGDLAASLGGLANMGASMGAGFGAGLGAGGSAGGSAGLGAGASASAAAGASASAGASLGAGASASAGLNALASAGLLDLMSGLSGPPVLLSLLLLILRQLERLFGFNVASTTPCGI